MKEAKETEKTKEKILNKKDNNPDKEKMIKIKESEHNALIKEVAEYKNKYIRLYAEFENARKRMARDKNEFVKYANEGLIIEFLDVLDNFERSMEAAQTKHEDYAAFLKGIEMVMAKLYDVLKENEVKPVESINRMFDPNCHEVLMQEESGDVEEGTVIEEFQKGYYLGGKVIRTAKVKVAKKKEL